MAHYESLDRGLWNSPIQIEKTQWFFFISLSSQFSFIQLLLFYFFFFFFFSCSLVCIFSFYRWISLFILCIYLFLLFLFFFFISCFTKKTHQLWKKNQGSLTRVKKVFFTVCTNTFIPSLSISNEITIFHGWDHLINQIPMFKCFSRFYFFIFKYYHLSFFTIDLNRQFTTDSIVITFLFFIFYLQFLLQSDIFHHIKLDNDRPSQLHKLQFR